VFTIVEKLPYNKHLINLVCLVRTVSYGFSFSPTFLWPTCYVLGPSGSGKNLVHNLWYGLHTQLIKGIYQSYYYFFLYKWDKLFRAKLSFIVLFPAWLVLIGLSYLFGVRDILVLLREGAGVTDLSLLNKTASASLDSIALCDDRACWRLSIFDWSSGNSFWKGTS
jgi:hypothetical protein